MTSLLPRISKTITVATPRKSKHGLFALPQAAETEEENIHTQPWHPLTFSESTASLASHASGTSYPGYPSFLPAATPRSLGPFAPEIDAQSLELAPLGWARTPRTPRLHGDSRRVMGDGQQLVEAKRALRGVGPGDWNAEMFARYRKQFTEEGRWLAIPGLNAVALKSSQEALDAGWYSLPSRPGNKGERIVLPQKSLCRWEGMDDVLETEPCAGVVPPPLVCSHRTPLDCARALGNLYRKHPVLVTLEATEFTKLGAGTEGHLLEGEDCRSLAQQEMCVRTNFKFASRMASSLSVKGPSPKARLSAKTDPSILVVEDLTLFRGDAPDGYPFLSSEEQLKLTALVSGRAVKRPMLSPNRHIETFLNQEDLICFMDRLNLLTYRALSSAEPGSYRPVLVLGLCGLTDAEHRQPRGSIVQALKVWRSAWAGHFQAVVVACGDENSANYLDRSVNLDVYKQIIQNQPVRPAAYEWHWDTGVLDLSTHRVLSIVAARVNLQRQHRMGSSCSTSATVAADERRKSGARRTSRAGMFMLGQALSDKPSEAGAVLKTSPKTSVAIAPTISEESMTAPSAEELAFVQRKSSLELNSRRSSADRRVSLAQGVGGKAEDARGRAERLAELRMNNDKARDPMEQARQGVKPGQPTGGEDVKRNVGVAAAAFQEFGAGGGKPVVYDPGPQPGMLEKRRIMQSAAAVHEMPSHLQAFVTKAIERDYAHRAHQENPNNQTKEEGTAEAKEHAEEDEDNEQRPTDAPAAPLHTTAEDVTRVFDEVQELAASLEHLLSNKRGETVVVDLKKMHPTKRTPSKDLSKVPSAKLLS